MSQATPKPVALSVAGFDPSGGAGVLADLKTFFAHDCYGVAAVACLTAQNTREIGRVEPVHPELLRSQIQMLLEDIAIAGIKIGLVGSKKNLEVIAESLTAYSHLPIVADPVLRSSSGTDLFPDRDLGAFRQIGRASCRERV